MLIRLRLLFFTILIFAGFSVGSLTAHACTNPAFLPSGFTNPCPVFSVTPTSTTPSGSITVTATPGANQYISQSFYIYNGSYWATSTFAGVFKKGYSTSTATYTIAGSQLSELPSGNIYLAEWDWTYNAGQKCFTGPSSTTCNAGYWRLQEFELSGGGGGSCSYNGSSQPYKYTCARTDLCETSTSTNPGGRPCTNPPGQPDSPLSFMGRNTSSSDGSYVPIDTAPSMGGLYGAGDCINDPDFGSKICRLTDYSMASTVGLSFSMSDNGENNWWSADDTKFLAASSGGGGLNLFAFSNDSNMTATVTDIGGSSSHGSATTFASGHVAFSTVYPNILYELDYGTITTSTGQPFIQINKLTLNDSGAPSTWTLTRTKLFNFITDSSNCLPTNDFFPNWAGTFQVSDGDQSFQFGLSDNGQNGSRGTDKKGVAHPYGATIIANYTVGKGCRVLDTYGNASDTGPGQIYGLNGSQPAIGPMTIWGDWGATGAVTNGAGITQIGISGGAQLPDTQYIHDSSVDDDPLYSSVSGSPDTTTTPENVSCWGKTTTGLCESYTWEVATTNIRPDLPEGHGADGYVYRYRGHYGQAFSYEAPWNPLGALITITMPGDNHGSYNNVDTDDDQPVFFFTTNVCDQASGAGSSPCDSEYTGPLYDEIVGVENAIAHPTYTDCNYGNGMDTTGCLYRFAHTFNTGTNWNFDGQNAIGSVSPNGRFAIFPSDWNLTLGCTNGSTACLDSITASGKNGCANPPNGLKNMNCQREDLFVVSLQ